jgi:Uma2 family endonuclease
MSVTTAPPLPNPADQPQRDLTVEQYLRLFDAGILTEDDRVELIDGLIMAQLPRGPEHDYALMVLSSRLFSLASDTFVVRSRSALILPTSVPEPDFVLARGRREMYRHRHIAYSDTALAMEVSALSLLRDRTDKSRIYARAGIPVYWVVNVIDKVIEVYTQPSGQVPAPAYGKRDDYAIGTAVPVVLDGQTVGTIAVADVMS